MSRNERLDEIHGLDDDDRRFLEQHARVIEIPPDTCIFAPGKRPEAFLVVLEGSVRVHQFGAGGREIVLYRVSGGESCIMTTACLLSDEAYLAEGITETPVIALALGRADFDALMARSTAFRRFVFSRYASRLTQLMGVLEDVAFERVDRRLARKLLEISAGSTTLDVTHQSLAVELGSAREVITRQIKDFASKGWLTSTRGRIEILDRQALTELARRP